MNSKLLIKDRQFAQTLSVWLLLGSLTCSLCLQVADQAFTFDVTLEEKMELVETDGEADQNNGFEEDKNTDDKWREAKMLSALQHDIDLQFRNAEVIDKWRDLYFDIITPPPEIAGS